MLHYRQSLFLFSSPRMLVVGTGVKEFHSEVRHKYTFFHKLVPVQKKSRSVCKHDNSQWCRVMVSSRLVVYSVVQRSGSYSPVVKSILSASLETASQDTRGSKIRDEMLLY